MYATHPVTVRNLPSWFGLLLVILAVIALALVALVATNALDLSWLFPAETVSTPVTTEMLQRVFLIEHRAEMGL